MISSIPTAIPFSTPATREVVFLDSRVEDIGSLLDNLGPGVEVVRIDSTQDGLAQMAAALGESGDVAAVHVLAHGSAGSMLLGSTVLSSNLAAHSEQLAAIGRAMTPDGDLLVCACDLAAGDAGAQFVSTLAELPGADVAASTTRTGAASLGGDWVLETHVGEIDAQAVVIARYSGVLETVAFSGSESLYDYSNITITKLLAGGIPITFQADSMGFDADGLYPYTNNSNDTRLVITVGNGYTFDLSSFRVNQSGVDGQIVYFTATNANGSANPGSNGTVTSFSTGATFSGMALSSLNDVKQVVISSNQYISLQDFNITDVKPAPPAAVAHTAALSSDSGLFGDFVTNVAVQNHQRNFIGQPRHWRQGRSLLQQRHLMDRCIQLHRWQQSVDRDYHVERFGHVPSASDWQQWV